MANSRIAAITTIPQTLEGAAAALRYVRELFEREKYPLCDDDGYRALLYSIESAINRALARAAVGRVSEA
jgi:hypothetical protein